MAVVGGHFAVDGSSTDATHTVVAVTDEIAVADGLGAATKELDIISTDAVCCTSGARYGLTGICGRRTTSTAHGDGSGADPGALVATYTGCASSSDGLGRDGSLSASIGVFTERTISNTVCMANTVGFGEVTDALVSTSTVAAFSAVSGTTDGNMSGRIGGCGRKTITTSQHVGSGAAPSECADICTASAR